MEQRDNVETLQGQVFAVTNDNVTVLYNGVPYIGITTKAFLRSFFMDQRGQVLTIRTVVKWFCGGDKVFDDKDIIIVFPRPK